VVTTYELKPEAGIKYSRITGLADDLCLALKAESILIERIPGKSTVGIEVPNVHRQTIALREQIESGEFVNSPSKLTLALGKDLIGRNRVSDLAQMPHLLIAGSTGTGKSVFLNSLILSMLYKATPDELKMVMVDPKRLELGLYEDIPHLLAPVVTDPKVASNVLRNATREMESRLKLLAERGVRNIDQYNRTFQKGQSLSLFDDAENSEHKPLPYIVIIIDELADLMMVDTSNVEAPVRGRNHRLDQSQLPGPYFLPRSQQSRFAHHSRCQRLGIAPGTRRYAVSARGLSAPEPHARPLRHRR
jgi:S-DNA-T family DNA segregation ATPase FtsK/SpoIIIE